MDYLHGTTTQHIGRANDQWKAYLLRSLNCVFPGFHGAVWRLQERQLVNQLLKTLPVFGLVNRVRRRSDYGNARRFQLPGQLERRLPAKLHNHTFGLFQFHHGHNVFKGQWLKVQTVRCVIVS